MTRSTTSSSCPATACPQPTTALPGPRPLRRGTTSAASTWLHSPHHPCSPSSSLSCRLSPNKLTVPAEPLIRPRVQHTHGRQEPVDQSSHPLPRQPVSLTA